MERAALAADPPPQIANGLPEIPPAEDVKASSPAEVPSFVPPPVPEASPVEDPQPEPASTMARPDEQAQPEPIPVMAPQVTEPEPAASTLPDPIANESFTFASPAQEEEASEPPAIIGTDKIQTRLPLLGVVALLLFAVIFFGLRTFFAAKPTTSVAPVVPRPVAAPQVILRLHGSNTIGAQLAPALVKAFFQDQGVRDLRVIQLGSDEAAVQGVMPGESLPKRIEIAAHGSATGFADFAGNRCDIGMASRKINAKEITELSRLGDMTSPASEHVLGLDGIAVIVNAANPVQYLTRDQISDIFSGAVTNWEQVSSPSGTIHVYARNSKSGTFDTFQNLVLGSRSLVATATRIEDSRELSDRVAADPDGIGFIGLPYIRSAKAIAVSDGAAKPLLPTRLTVSTEDYVLSRRLYLYTPERPTNALVPKFLAFALSRAGQELVADNGFVPLIVQAEPVVVAEDAPPRYRRLTAGAERLSLDFRFRSSSTELDNKAIADLDRVVASLGELKLSAENTMLIGFAESTGGENSNLALAQERAKAVADQLATRGLTPEVVTAFGSALPVASNATVEGRQKNRRVEIWVKK